MSKYRKFDLKKIEKALNGVKSNFAEINDQLLLKREMMTDVIIENIISAYDYLNGLLSKGMDLFNPAGLHAICELNHIILCGRDEEKRYEFHKHINETRERFNQGIRPILKWYKKNTGLKPFKLATGFYIRALSQPQLFFEGNHRTENIVINYILMGRNVAPFILTTLNAVEYFEPSAKVKFTHKNKIKSNLFTFPDQQKTLMKLLKKHVDDRYIK